MTFTMSDKAQTIRIFNLRADTHEFIGAGDAYIPPHTGLPANSTTLAPPDIPAGQVAIFNDNKQEWTLSEDHRGEIVYNTDTAQTVFIDAPGSLPENTTTQPPDVPYPLWNGNEWVSDATAEHAGQVANATELKSSLMLEASERIATLQDAVDLGMATDDEQNQLTAWKTYRVELSRVNPEDAPDIGWPDKPND